MRGEGVASCKKLFVYEKNLKNFNGLHEIVCMAYNVLHDRLCICLVPCKLSYLYMQRYPRNMTKFSKKMSDHSKKQKRGFHRLVYRWYM